MKEKWMRDVEAIRRLHPRHILFMCVANSARSQIAEGLARRHAPQDVRISSAGSTPTFVRPQAIEVLREIGIDISHHTSKDLSSIDTASVDVVITLCAEEVCPVFPHKVLTVHWPLPDPAAFKGDEAAVLRAFREIRDELDRRIRLLF